MPIEFRCSGCGRLLRTPDETAGQAAQCPACGRVSTVPTPAGAQQPPGAAATSDTLPYGPNPPWPAYAPYDAASAAARVSGPAIGLIVVACLGLAASVVGLAASLVQLGMAVPPPPQGPFADMPPGVTISSVFVSLVLDVFILIGAIRMKRLDGYGWAMAAAIIAMIPCTSPCCVLNMPFGIWALVVLLGDGVRASFR